MSEVVPVVELSKGHPVVLSTHVAEHFKKSHQHVLRDIKALIAAVPECASNFGRTFVQLPMPKGGFRESPAYNMDRDGFTLLAMGFTGRDALQWKLRYIQAFNAMEAKLREDALPSSPALSTVADRRPLIEACNLLVETRYLPKPVERDYAKVRADVSKFLGVDKWEDIRTEDIPKALEFVQVQISADIQVKASP
ncbi:MAG: Rha family transcriptional regulator, partial [Pseudodesulfovibrio sp.]|uniref:Rha family transcriptional regulator n=1 Tax=Pseudodesulfovibrio sp. TaxID=2035812 RepID=UPI003D09CE44